MIWNEDVKLGEVRIPQNTALIECEEDNVDLEVTKSKRCAC